MVTMLERHLATAGRSGLRALTASVDSTNGTDPAAGWEANARAVLESLGISVDDHIIEFREAGWGIEHSLMCRLAGALIDCPIDRLAREVLTEPPGMLGRFSVWIDTDGELSWGELT